MRNRKVENLFYAGQLTVPGPGIPPALISGEIAAGEIHKQLQSSYHETIV
jgi:phytoene desaturase